MPKNDVFILTSYNQVFGKGHFFRMCTLGKFLEEKGVSVKIFSNEIPNGIPLDVLNLFVTEADVDAKVIVRDKRDSSAQEITKLKQNAKVIVIDDIGSGRDVADKAIDFLPNLKYEYNDNFFVPGFSYYNYINSNKDKIIEKQKQILLYSPCKEDNNFLEMLQKTGYEIKIAGENGVVFEKELLLSKVFVSHFGVSFFEANFAKTKIASIAISDYHLDLAVNVQKEMGLCNVGLYPNLNYGMLIDYIKKEMANESISININTLAKEIEKKVENVYTEIIQFL